MKLLRGFIFSLLAVIVLVLFLFFRFEISNLLSNLKASVLSFFDRGFSYKEFQIIKVEKDFSSFQDNSKNKDSLKENSVFTEKGYIVAEVFSSYPFNDQNKLIINRGSNDGVKEGMPVLITDNVLLGRVSKVRKSLSEVQTIFDPNWRSTVAIGSSKIRSLLKGGRIPLLTFISKDRIPAVGDEVINITSEYPYGFYLGKVKGVEVNTSEPWVTAILETGYDPNLLDRVFVVLNYEIE